MKSKNLKDRREATHLLTVVATTAVTVTVTTMTPTATSIPVLLLTNPVLNVPIIQLDLPIHQSLSSGQRTMLLLTNSQVIHSIMCIVMTTMIKLQERMLE